MWNGYGVFSNLASSGEPPVFHMTTLTTAIHLYQALVIYVLLYGTETWTLLVADMNTLEAISDRYSMYAGGLVSNVKVLQRSGLSSIGDILRHQRLSLFGHVTRLGPTST